MFCVCVPKIVATAGTCQATNASIPDDGDGQAWQLPSLGHSLTGTSLYTLQAYDSVWALAAAVAAAMNELDLQCPPTGDQVVSVIRNGLTPSFNGARGFNKFAANGDASTESLTMKFTSFARHNGEPVASTATVGSWTRATGAVLSTEQPVVWSDGSVYPQVIAQVLSSHTMAGSTIVSLFASIRTGWLQWACCPGEPPAALLADPWMSGLAIYERIRVSVVLLAMY